MIRRNQLLINTNLKHFEKLIGFMELKEKLYNK
jgi:hypothetical protein